MRLLQMLGAKGTGGAEAFFVKLARAFAGAGIEQKILLRAHGEREEAFSRAKIPCETAPFETWTDFGRTSRKLQKIVAEFRPDVALSFMSRASMYMPDGPHLKVGRIGGYYDIKYFKRCDQLVCNTPGLVRHMVQQGWPEDRTHLIWNFTEVSSAAPMDRALFDTPETVPLILIPARLHRVKGIDTALSALAEVPEAYLWIAGEGGERQALEQLSEELGVSARTRFLGWQENVGALLKAADIVLLPSREEPFGNVNIEAWAYGKPLVTTATEGSTSLVRPGDDALMVEIDRASEMASALRQLIEDKSFATALVEAGHARFEADFTAEKCVASYLEHFERTL